MVQPFQWRFLRWKSQWPPMRFALVAVAIAGKLLGRLWEREETSNMAVSICGWQYKLPASLGYAALTCNITRRLNASLQIPTPALHWGVTLEYCPYRNTTCLTNRWPRRVLANIRSSLKIAQHFINTTQPHDRPQAITVIAHRFERIRWELVPGITACPLSPCVQQSDEVKPTCESLNLRSTLRATIACTHLVNE